MDWKKALPVVGAGLIVSAALVTTAIATQPAEAAQDSTRGSTTIDSGRPGWIREALQQLVDDGTITSEQADAVADRLAQGRPPRSEGGRGDQNRGALGLQDAAAAIGIELDALLAELDQGSTIAEVAIDNGVEPAVVVESLVASAIARVDAALAAGRIDAVQAEQLKEEVPVQIEAFVNGEKYREPA